MPMITHSYDATTHDLVATKLPEGGLTTYTYDGHHSISSTAEQTTCVGCATSWQGTLTGYDAYGERTSTTDGRGVSVTNGIVTPNGQASAYASHQGYDAQGDLTSASTPPITTTLGGVTTTASAVTTTYTYDGDGNRQTLVSANAHTTTYGYDHLARPVTTTLPLITLYNNISVQPVQTTGYDADGNVVRTVTGNGDTTTSSYDPLGRLVAETNPISGTTVTTYTASELTATQDPQGHVTGYGYDAAGRQIQTTNPATGTEQTAYDAAGNTLALTTTDRANGNAVVALDQMGYDALNRVITATVVTNTANVAGSALTTLTAYDQDGNVAQTQQPTGDVVYNEYDAADRLTNVEIDPGPAPLTKAQAATHPSYEAYSYDAAGNQTVAVDADNRTTTSQYDGDNRAVQSVAASTAPTGTTTITTSSQYDPDGNTLRQTTQTVDSTNPGQVQTHTVTDAYNAADWETATTDDGYTTTYGYDAAGQQTTETIVDGSTPVTMQLDPEGRVTAIGESYGGAGPYTSQFGYNADDLPTTWTRPGGVTEAAGYDANSALTSLVAQGPNTGVTTTTLSTAYGYGYNAAGWTTSTTTISGTDTLTHDGLGRLTSDCGPQSLVRNTGDHCYRWTYDGNGNLTSQVADNGASEVYAYSPTQPNEVTQATFQQSNVPPNDQYKNVTTSYGYDGNGDTTAITSPVNGAYTDTAAINDHLQYDAEQRPITITHLEGGVPITISLGYNADGLRDRYTVVMSGTAIDDERFQYRDGALAQVSAITATLNANGSIKSQGMPYTDTFIYGPSGEPMEFLRQQNNQTNRYWYTLDGQGSVVAVTDKTGAVVDRYNYDSWGELVGRYPETVPQQLRYAGYWYDSEMEWYWLTTRYYNPEDLRFLQPDPSDLDGVHTYAYVGDDPLDGTDPIGLDYCVHPVGPFGPVICVPTPHIGNPFGNPCNVPIIGDMCAQNVAAAERKERAQRPVIVVTHGARGVTIDVILNGKLVPIPKYDAEFAAHWGVPVLALLGAAVLPHSSRGSNEEVYLTFYRGTTLGSALEVVESQSFDVERIARNQEYWSITNRGVYITSQKGTAVSFANLAGGEGRGLGPGVIRIDVDRGKFEEFVQRTGIAVETPIVRPLAPGQTETIIPFENVSEFEAFAAFSSAPYNESEMEP